MPIELVDVGPRDGLQNEATTLAPAVRAELCNRLAAAGLRRVEAASFVDPRLVPPMAGAEEVLAGVDPSSGVRIAGLALNERGYERALAAGVDEVRYAFGVTDGFARRNQNSTAQAGAALAVRLVERARADGVGVSVTLSVAFGCPFDGPVAPERVLRLGTEVLEAAPDELVLADTIGVGVPTQVSRLVGALAGGPAKLGGHFHNTRNTGYANAVAALEAGATVLDASVGGTGGCPFAPRATGNVATEDLVYLLEGMGIDTGADLGALIATAGWLGERLGKPLPGLLQRAGPFDLTRD